MIYLRWENLLSDPFCEDFRKATYFVTEDNGAAGVLAEIYSAACKT